LKALPIVEEEIAAASVEELRDAYREVLAENQALRKLISERTCSAVGDLREKGLKYNGNLPYGVESDEETKKLKPSRYEKRLIREVKKLYAAELSLRAIARTLTEQHFVNRSGNPIDAKQVARILDAEGVERKRRAVE
jgi:DNA invertase Pin-like site-specific DNA recombinase